MELLAGQNIESSFLMVLLLFQTCVADFLGQMK